MKDGQKIAKGSKKTAIRLWKLAELDKLEKLAKIARPKWSKLQNLKLIFSRTTQITFYFLTQLRNLNFFLTQLKTFSFTQLKILSCAT